MMDFGPSTPEFRADYCTADMNLCFHLFVESTLGTKNGYVKRSVGCFTSTWEKKRIAAGKECGKVTV